MKMKNTTWIAVAAWIATAIAVIVALFLTKEPKCLFAFILPASLELVHKEEVKEEDEK